MRSSRLRCKGLRDLLAASLATSPARSSFQLQCTLSVGSLTKICLRSACTVVQLIQEYLTEPLFLHSACLILHRPPAAAAIGALADLAAFLISSERPRRSWRADGFRGCWEDQAHAILEDQRLALVTNLSELSKALKKGLGVHHGTVAVAIDVSLQSLMRSAPADVAHLRGNSLRLYIIFHTLFTKRPCGWASSSSRSHRRPSKMPAPPLARNSTGV